MLSDILLLFRIRMTRKVNGFFYYLKKLPLIGRLLKESCYAAVNLKGVQQNDFEDRIVSLLQEEVKHAE